MTKKNLFKIFGACVVAVIVLLIFTFIKQERIINDTHEYLSYYKNIELVRMKNLEDKGKNREEIIGVLLEIQLRMETLSELFSIDRSYYSYKEKKEVISQGNSAIEFFSSYSTAANMQLAKYEKNKEYISLDEYNELLNDIKLIIDAFEADYTATHIKDDNLEEVNQIISSLKEKSKTD